MKRSFYLTVKQFPVAHIQNTIKYCKKPGSLETKCAFVEFRVHCAVQWHGCRVLFSRV